MDDDEDLSINDKLRQLTDENSRLYRLLAEKDLEIKRFQNKSENEKVLSEFNLNGGDAVAMKIIEMSKKIREQNSEIEVEKNKVRQLQKKCSDYEKQLFSNANKKEILSPEVEKTEIQIKNEEIKILQEKYKQSEMKVSEYRNQLQAHKNEIKLLNKVLIQEVGENISVQSLLNNPGSWKGRVQQISTLQRKISELKKQLEERANNVGSAKSELNVAAEVEDYDYLFMEPSQSSSASLFTTNNQSTNNNTTFEDKQRDKIKQIEKTRKENIEKMKSDLKALEQEHNNLKQKHDAIKARNQVLTGETKSLKQQVQMLMEKGKHDDELVEALLKQLNQLKQALVNDSNVMKERMDLRLEQQLSRNSPINGKTKEQYEKIINEKELKLIELEEKLRDAYLHNAITNNTSANNNNDVNKTNNSNNNNNNNIVKKRRDIIEDNKLIKEPQDEISSYYYMSTSPDSLNGDATYGKSNDKNLANELLELKALYKAVTVERDKLNELIHIMETRNKQLTLQLTEVQGKLQNQLKLSASLEKQVGKYKLDKSGSMHSKNSSTLGPFGAGGDWLKQNNDDLLLKLEIQKDEIDALKASLQSTLKSREEDVNVYTSMIEESKKIFIETLRKQQNEPNKSFT